VMPITVMPSALTIQTEVCFKLKKLLQIILDNNLGSWA